MAYINFAIASKTNRAASLNTDCGNSAVIVLYTGSAPATPDTAATGTILANLGGNSGGFGTVSSGTLTASAINSVVATASGTCGYARIWKANGTTPVMDLDVGTSGTSLIIGSTTISSGETVQITSLTITEE